MIPQQSSSTTNPHRLLQGAHGRRTFLVAGGLGFCGVPLADRLVAQTPGNAAVAPAKSTILIWLSGGASHIDTWDMKPAAPVEFRGPFQSQATSAPAIQLCEHLPQLARQAHHLAVIRSLGHYRRGTGDHHAGYYYNLTGKAPDPSFPALLNSRTPRPTDWPFMGSVVGYKMPTHPYLPQSIALPLKPGAPDYTRPGQFAARLGAEHDSLYLMGDTEDPLHFAAPEFALQGEVSVNRLTSRRELLNTLNTAERAFNRSRGVAALNSQQQQAFSLLSGAQTKDAFDVSRESPALRERYGATLNGISMLMARRLVEAEVPFVSVFWKGNKKLAEARNCKSGGGWDTHGNNFKCLSDVLLPEFDQAFSALLEDLNDRGLLDQTLVLVNSEMGRKPRIGDPRSGGVKGAGRDHWTHAMSVLMAGGGIRGGQTFGTSDRVAAYPADLPVAPEDVAKTVYHAMGIDDLTATDRTGRAFQLLDEGRILSELF